MSSYRYLYIFFFRFFNYYCITLEILLNTNINFIINFYNLFFFFSVQTIVIENFCYESVLHCFLPFIFTLLNKNNKRYLFLRNFTTKLEIVININPWYITGYSDGDSSF